MVLALLKSTLTPRTWALAASNLGRSSWKATISLVQVSVKAAM